MLNFDSKKRYNLSIIDSDGEGEIILKNVSIQSTEKDHVIVVDHSGKEHIFLGSIRIRLDEI